jgi:type II secretion system protein H
LTAPAVFRDGAAGLTLVEVLVVLVLIATVAGAVGLNLGPGRGEATLDSELALLRARMERASDEALLAGTPVAFAWSGTGYRFLGWTAAGWAPHRVEILGTPHELPDAVRLRQEDAREGVFVVTAQLLPAQGTPLVLSVGEGGAERLVWDGASARREPAP